MPRAVAWCIDCCRLYGYNFDEGDASENDGVQEAVRKAQTDMFDRLEGEG
jgi:hypothetical protein